MKLKILTKDDLKLVESASKLLKKYYHKQRHTVAVAMKCGTGEIYSSINVSSHMYCSHAEPIVLGSAISNGEKQFKDIVAVEMTSSGIKIVQPCGACRQLLSDYANNINVFINFENENYKTTINDLLPYAYISKRAIK